MKKYNLEKANEKRIKNADWFAEKIFEILRESDHNFYTKNGKIIYEEIAKYLNYKNVPARRGGIWNRKQSSRIIERIKKMKNKYI